MLLILAIRKNARCSFSGKRCSRRLLAINAVAFTDSSFSWPEVGYRKTASSPDFGCDGFDEIRVDTSEMTY